MSDLNSPNLIIVGISICVVILILLVVLESGRCGYNKWDQYNQFLAGFWKADPEWCAEAGISNIYSTISFNPKTKHGVIYLLIQNENGDLIENNSFTFITKYKLTEVLGTNKPNVECNLVFTEPNNDDNESKDIRTPLNGFFPINCKLIMNKCDGVLILHNGETVFLELFKDTITSSYIERYLPGQLRTDPQTDSLSYIPSSSDNKEKYLPEQPRTDPQMDLPGLNPSLQGNINSIPRDFQSNSLHDDGESIIINNLHPSEGESIN